MWVLLLSLLTPVSPSVLAAEDPGLHPEWETENLLEVSFEKPDDDLEERIKKTLKWVKPNEKALIPARDFLSVVGVPNLATYQRTNLVFGNPLPSYTARLREASDHALAKVQLAKILDELAYRQGLRAQVPRERTLYFLRSSLLTMAEIRQALLRAKQAEGATLTERESADLAALDAFLGNEATDLSDAAPIEWQRLFEITQRFREGKNDALLTKWSYHCEEQEIDYTASVGKPYGLQGKLLVRHPKRLETLCRTNLVEAGTPLALEDRMRAGNMLDPSANGNFRIVVQFAALRDLGELHQKIEARLRPLYEALLRDRVFGSLENALLRGKGGLDAWVSASVRQDDLDRQHAAYVRLRDRYRSMKSEEKEGAVPPVTPFDEADYTIEGTEVRLSSENMEAFAEALKAASSGFEAELSKWAEAKTKEVEALPQEERDAAYAALVAEYRRKFFEARTGGSAKWIAEAIAAASPGAASEEIRIRHALRDGTDPESLDALLGLRLSALHPVLGGESGQGLLAQFNGQAGRMPSLLPLAAYRDPKDPGSVRVFIGRALTNHLDQDGLPALLASEGELGKRIGRALFREKFRLFAKREVVYQLFRKNPIRPLIPQPWRIPGAYVAEGESAETEVQVLVMSDHLWLPDLQANRLVTEIPYDSQVQPNYTVTESGQESTRITARAPEPPRYKDFFGNGSYTTIGEEKLLKTEIGSMASTLWSVLTVPVSKTR